MEFNVRDNVQEIKKKVQHFTKMFVLYVHMWVRIMNGPIKPSEDLFRSLTLY